MKKKIKKFKKYIFLFFCIFFISITTSTYSNYKDSFKIRYNILIRNYAHNNINSLVGINAYGKYVNELANNNIYFFTKSFENFENFYFFKHEITKKLMESSIVKINNTFLNNKYLRNEIHLVPGLVRWNENPDSYLRLTTHWIDKRTFPLDNLDFIEKEIKKIFMDVRNKNIEKQKKKIKLEYIRLSENINSFCKAQELELNYLKKQNSVTPEVKKIKLDLTRNINQCLIALERIKKKIFFENVMKTNEILANNNPLFSINTIAEQHQIKKNIQLFYENILISILVFISILFLKNLTMKLIK